MSRMISRRRSSFSRSMGMSMMAASRRREEERRMIEHRKNSPVIYNDDEWQLNRCVKALSMQPCIKNLLPIIEEARRIVIARKEEKIDEKLLEVGNDYEVLKSVLDNDIKALNNLNVSIDGRQHELTRLADHGKISEKPQPDIEFYGNSFRTMDLEPIELDDDILSSENYFEDRYDEMNPKVLEKEYKKSNSRINRYRKIGKYLGFLLKTDRYLTFEKQSGNINEKYCECVLRKREMDSFNALNKEQLLAIRSYVIDLDQLIKTSDIIGELFYERAYLYNEENRIVYDLAIKEILPNEEYTEILSQVSEYINKMISNDEETMNEAYELVKGEYPIELSRRIIYDLIISNIKDYRKESEKVKKLI